MQLHKTVFLQYDEMVSIYFFQYLMQGYLQIWKGFIPHWNRYYFRIHEQLLLYGPTKQEIEGKVHLKIAQIISKLDDPISLMIHTGTQTIDLRAYSIDEKVKWYKKLKQVQKQAIDLAQNKQLFKMKVQLSKINRFKILDDLNTQLWKCHAQLEQRLEDVIEKVKNVQVLKSIDRLRISSDEFKYKTSQILQYIDEQIRDLKFKDRDKSAYSKQHSKKMSTGYYQNDFDINEQLNNGVQDTQFYSFYDDSPQKQKKANSKTNYRMQKIQEQEDSSLSSLSVNLKQRKSIYETPRPKKYRSTKSDASFEENNQKERLKQTFVNENKVFQKYPHAISLFENRSSLPEKFTPQQKFAVLSTFTSALTSGADITKMTIPVVMNEPISALQKGCEQMLYCSLLNRADSSDDENLRILYVAAFAVAGYSLNEFRIKKPFTPLLGETFEFIDEGKGFQFLAEQVSEQPPISAYYVRSDSYEIFDSSRSKSSFIGNGIKTVPQSKTIIKLEKNDDKYVVSKAQVTLTNILFGKTYIDILGEITIKCKQFNTQIILEFQEESFWRGTKACSIIGHLSNNGKKVYNIQGYWNKQLIAENIQTKERLVLWKKSHQILTDYYNFNELAIQLNNLTHQAFKALPPTDSRLRPDQRALQYRDMDLAAQQKQRLEEKQRKRKQFEPTKVHKALWFKESVLQGQDVYVSNDRYWDEKIKGSWKQCLDIF